MTLSFYNKTYKYYLLLNSVNNMLMNVDNFFRITFSRDVSIANLYKVDGSVLQTVSTICYFGVIFSSNPAFKKHITNVSQRASNFLDFIPRALKDIRHISTMRILFISFLRLLLEYGSIN